MKIKFILMLLIIAPWSKAEETANGKCEEGKDEYCAACVEKKCTTCYASYAKDGQCMAPETALDNCIMYTDATTCAGCDSKYGLASGKCTALTVENCLAANGSDCLVCDGLHDSEDEKKCKGTACTIAECTSCKTVESKENCTSCNLGYSVSSDKLKCEANAEAGCSTATGCTSCIYGYYVSSASTADKMTCAKSTRYGSTSIVGTILMTFVAFMSF